MKEPKKRFAAFARSRRTRRFRPLSAYVSFCCLLLTQPLSAQDWPHWLGPDRNGKVTGFKAPAQWPKELTRQWRQSIGLGESTPALVGERLYAFARQQGSEVLVSLDARNGSELWRYSYPAVAVTGPAKPYPGPRSSPAVTGDKVIALGVGGVLTCLHAGTGKLAWKRDDLTNNIAQFFTSASPLIVDGLCIVHLGGQDAGCLIAVSVDTGETRWKWEGEGPSYASAVPLTLGGATQVVLLTEKSLMGLSAAEGKPLWRISTPLEPGYWNSATPLVDGQTVFYSGQGTGTRAVRVEKAGATINARPLWHNDQIGTVYNTPILHDNLLFAISDRGRYFCLDAQTGTTAWTSTNRVSNFCTLLDAGGVLVGLPEKSNLVFCKPSRQGYEELAHYRVSDTPLYAFPLLSGNRIYVRDQDSIALWTIDSKVAQ